MFRSMKCVDSDQQVLAALTGVTHSLRRRAITSARGQSCRRSIIAAVQDHQLTCGTKFETPAELDKLCVSWSWHKRHSRLLEISHHVQLVILLGTAHKLLDLGHTHTHTPAAPSSSAPQTGQEQVRCWDSTTQLPALPLGCQPQDLQQPAFPLLLQRVSRERLPGRPQVAVARVPLLLPLLQPRALRSGTPSRRLLLLMMWMMLTGCSCGGP